MEVDNPVSIEYNHGTNRFRSFTVTCHSHRVTTIVTSKPSVVRSWIYRFRRRHYHRIRHNRIVVGLGVQWRPNSSPGARHNPPATLQLCAGHHCLIFQLRHSPTVPNALRRFLSNRAISFVGVSVQNDANLLENYSRHRLSVPRLIELRQVAHKRRGTPKLISMENLADWVLELHGVTKPTRVGRSNWNSYRLSEEQVEYACIDAFISSLLGRQLRVWNWDGDEEDE